VARTAAAPLENRARQLFGQDAAAAPAAAAPSGRMVPTGSGGYSFVPAPARPSAVSSPAPQPARAAAIGSDARPSAFGSQSVGNAAWTRSGGRSI
jgi:hypothetical protein